MENTVNMKRLKNIAIGLGAIYTCLLLFNVGYIKLYGQSPAQSLTTVVYANITANSRLDGCDVTSHPCIDNRSQFTRQSSMSSYRAISNGSGSWSVDMQYADGTPNVWTSFGSTAQVTNAAPASGIGFGIGPSTLAKQYHDYIRFVMTGNVIIVNYSGTRQFWWLPAVASVAFPITATQGGTAGAFAVDQLYGTAALGCAAAISAGETLVVTQNWAIPATTSMNCPITFFAGGKFTVAASQTLTIGGSLSCPSKQQCFNISASASSVLAVAGSITEAFPRWFGGVGDNMADDTKPVLAAVKMARSASASMNIGAGTFNTDPISLQTDDKWHGLGSGQSCLGSRGGGVIATTVTGEMDRTVLHDFCIQGTGSGSGVGISIISTVSSSSNNWYNLNFLVNGGTCIYFKLGFNNHFHDIQGACGYGGTGNFIDISAGNSSSVDNNYCYFVGVNGRCYRIHDGYLKMDSNNGINGGTGTVWGEFGNVIGEDGSNDFAFVELTNSNVESFGSIGLRFKSGSCAPIIHGGKITSGNGVTAKAISYDFPGCTGDINNVVISLGSGASWTNGQAIHYTSGVPFFNFGGGIGSPGTNVLTAWDDGNAHVVNIPNFTSVYNGNFVNGIQIDHVQLPDVYLFNLGSRGNSTIAPITQAYDGSCTPIDGLAHVKGEIGWNPNVDATGSNAYMGCLCVTSGSPGAWSKFGGPAGGLTPQVTPANDVVVIASGTNGCGSAKCWQVNGALGPPLAAATGQSGIYFPTPTGAGVYVSNIREKSTVACTGTTTATLDIATAGGLNYTSGSSYDIHAAPANSNLFPSSTLHMAFFGSDSDSSTTLGALVSTTGGNVSALVVGCEFKVWIEYWNAQ